MIGIVGPATITITSTITHGEGNLNEEKVSNYWGPLPMIMDSGLIFLTYILNLEMSLNSSFCVLCSSKFVFTEEVEWVGDCQECIGE